MERISHGDINMNQSYWQKTSSIQRCASIQDDMDTDIVIIGAGMAGVSLAYQLKDLPYRVIVVDKDQIASHTSGHTTAKLTVLHGKIYPLLKKHYNIHFTFSLVITRILQNLPLAILLFILSKVHWHSFALLAAASGITFIYSFILQLYIIKDEMFLLQYRNIIGRLTHKQI